MGKATSPKSTRPAKGAVKSKKPARKQVTASSATALKAAANAEKTAQPGIIASICTALTTAKSKKAMLTVTEIVAQLKAKYPEREEAGMTTTVRAQLSRLPKEREFAIKKTRDGREMRYAAA